MSVVLPNGLDARMQLALNRGVPVLFFREDGSLRGNQQKVGAQDVLVLAQSQTVLDASTIANSPFNAEDLGPVRGWPGWSLRCVAGGSLTSLTVKHRAHRHVFHVDRKVEAHWVDNDATAPFLKGEDLGPVFQRSPQLVIPADNSLWSLEYFHVDADGNRVSFDTYQVEDDYRDEPFDVFDELDEPWVGRYEVVVRRDAKVHMRRTFNMAEGLDARLSFEQAVQRGRFRVPHMPGNKPGLSRALVEFSSSSRWRIKFPEGAQALGSQHRTRFFLISSASDPETYWLKVQVDAPRLQYLLPRRDEPARWSDSPVTINTDELADNDEIHVKFPQRVHEVEIRVAMTAPGGRIVKMEVITLSRKGSSNVWFCPVSRLVSLLDTNATFQVLVSWHLITLDDFLRNSMDKYARKEWFKMSPKKRPDPRERATAFLFSITRKPLLVGADIVDDELHLRLGRESELPLTTWAWLLEDPVADPVRIPWTGRRGKLPRELLDAGPLIIDTREEEFLVSWEPEIPSNRSLVVGESILNPALDPTNRHRWLFTRDRELLPGEIQTVWGIRDRMHNVLAQGRNRSHPTLNQLESTTLDYLTTSPRVSLAELDNSDVPRERRLEAFIRSGLAIQDFSSATTAGDIHPTPWIGLIQEMNDLRTLTQSSSADATTAAERAESEHYVRHVGGHDLWKIFSGESQGIPPVQKNVLSPTELVLVRGQEVAAIRESLGFSTVGSAFISDEARTSAQLAWMENRREFSSISRLEEMFRELQKWENLIDHLNDPELKRTSRSLALIAEENHRSAEDNWLSVPYVSFVSSLLSRAVAHNIIRPVAGLHHLRHTWASCARYAPELVSFDLVVAEAATLNARS